VPPGKGAVNGVRKKQESEFDDEDVDEEEYEEEEDYEEEEEEDEEEEEEAEEEAEEDEPDEKRTPRRVAAPVPLPKGRQPPAVNGAKPNSRDDFFNFGNNLTVTGK
jgi:RNA-splicing ligase RtcB